MCGGVASEGARSDAVATTAAYVGNRIMNVEVLPLSPGGLCDLKDVQPGRC